MYIAMNRFQVAKGQEHAFETLWKSRESHLSDVPGFIDFKLLKGPEAKEHTLYASHSTWADEAAFRAWTKSEHFRKAHRDAGSSGALYLGPPVFEGFVPVEGA